MVITMLLLISLKAVHMNRQQTQEDSDSKALIDFLTSVIKEGIKKDPGIRLMPKEQFKEGWCIEKKVNITLSHPKCVDTIVETNYCWGQCNSLHIPGKNMFRSCLQCRAKTVEKKMFALNCSNAKKTKVRFVKKDIVSSCECLACENHDRYEAFSFK